VCELTRKDKIKVWQRDRYRCKYCGRKVTDYNLSDSALPDDAATIDHVTPRASGGTNALSNLVTACHECNHELGNKFTTYGEKVNYINLPDKHQQELYRWEKHMRFVERRKICAYC
jgi:5-methylcytosine-specific restriction endonuclease McrA